MTKKKHKHIDKSIKMESSNEVNIQVLSRVITLVLLVYVAIRFIILGLTLNAENVNVYYFVRHTLYCVTWLMLAYFFYIYSFHVDITRGKSTGFIQTAQAALVAILGCVMKGVLVITYTFPWLNYGLRRNSYVVVECLFWVVLVAFFYKYRQHCLKNHEQMDKYRKVNKETTTSSPLGEEGSNQ